MFDRPITDQKEATAQTRLSIRVIQAHEDERTRIAWALDDDIHRTALLADGLEEVQLILADWERVRDNRKLPDELWC
jgi:hypothetical protein